MRLHAHWKTCAPKRTQLLHAYEANFTSKSDFKPCYIHQLQNEDLNLPFEIKKVSAIGMQHLFSLNQRVHFAGHSSLEVIEYC